MSPLIDDLKQRARSGDAQALQQLRNMGFFGTRATAPAAYALSHAQRRLWLLDQGSGGSAYNLPRAVLLRGPVDPAALERAFTALVARHEALRTRFGLVGDEPRQLVHAAGPVSLVQHDLRGRPDPLAAARAHAQAEAGRRFDLEHGPLFSVQLLHVADDCQVLLFNVHHIVCDAWSLDVMVADLSALHAGMQLPPLVRQYKDFAAWHNERLASSDGQAQRAWWRRQLSPLPEPLDLPSDQPRHEDTSWSGELLDVDFGATLSARLQDFANASRAGLFTTLLTGVKALLHLESGATEITVGAPVAGRGHADLEPLVGSFANALVLRDRVGGEEPWDTLLDRVGRTVHEALARQEVPFDTVLDDCAAPRRAARTPLYDVMVGLLNTEHRGLQLGALQAEDFAVATGQVPHDLVFYFAQSGGSLRLTLGYRDALWSRASATRLAERLQVLLKAALEAPRCPLRELPLGPAALSAPHPRTAQVVDIEVDLDALAQRLRAQAGLAASAILATPRAATPLTAFLVAADARERAAVLAHAGPALGEAAAHCALCPISALPLDGSGRVHVRALERLLADSALDLVPPPSRLHAWELAPTTATGLIAPRAETPQAQAPQGPPALAGGLPLAVDGRTPWTLGSALRHAAESAPQARLVFIDRQQARREYSYAELELEALRVTGGLQAGGGVAGEDVLLLLSEPGDAVPAFWGCVLGGLRPLIAQVPPDFGASHRARDQLLHLWRLFEAPRIITTAPVRERLLAAGLLQGLQADRVLALEALRASSPALRAAEPQPDDIAFFSLTSGSTGAPKAVMLTHRNALARARGANAACAHLPADRILNWLPFDHIGTLSDWHLRCVEIGCDAVYVPTEPFIADPLRWIESLHELRATHSWAPNFAYGLVVKALQEREGALPAWDLSGVRGLLTAGEAVTPAAVDRFCTGLAPFGFRAAALRPAFGMAEMASGVTYGGQVEEPIGFHRIDRRTLGERLQPAAEGRDAAVFADLGPPIPGVSLRVVSEEGHPLPEWVIGRLQIRGAPISRGYYRDAGATAAAFLPEGWFDTGDHAFLANGRLVLTGRAKDGVIVNGANYSSAEIEAAAEAVEGVAASFVAAAAVRRVQDGGERAAIFFSVSRGATPSVAAALRAGVAERIGIAVDYLVPLEPAEFPKTPIGKIQRPQLVRRFEAGEFDDRVIALDLALGGERTVPHGFSQRRWLPCEPVVAPLPSLDEDGLWSEGLAAVPEADLDPALGAGLARLLAWLQAQARDPRPRPLVVLTRGGQLVDAGDVLLGDRGGWAALVQVAAQEAPWLDLRCVDLDGVADEPSALRDCLRAELAQPAPQRPVAWRRGRRHVLGLERAAFAPAGTPALQPGGLYLVSGGGGGVGQVVLRHLRQKLDLRLLVIGRRSDSPLTGLSDPSIVYRCAPVQDEQAVADAVRDALRHFGLRLRGALHLADSAADAALAQTTPQSLEQALASKAAGLRALGRVVADMGGPEASLVSFTSVNGLFGGRSTAAYAAANALADALGEALRRQGRLRCWSIAWTQWDDLGKSQGYALREASHARGFSLLRAEAALLSLDAVLARPAAGWVLGLDTDNGHVSPWFEALARPLREAAADPAREMPATPTEQRLAQLWCELLSVPQVVRDDHFIRLGGHSLKATQMAGRIEQAFGVRLALEDIFLAPTLRAQAARIDAGGHGRATVIPRCPDAPDHPASPAQRRLWIIERMGRVGSTYHISGASRLRGPFDPAGLQAALQALVRRHESLRTTFIEKDCEPRQVVHQDLPPAFAVEDLRGQGLNEVQLAQRVESVCEPSFDLAAGPLLRLRLLRLADDDAVLVLCMHHIVSDGWSMKVLVDELLADLRGWAAPAPLRVHYRDYAAWQVAHLAERAEADRRYWLSQLAPPLPVLALPADAPRPAVTSFRGALVQARIDAATGAALCALAARHEATPFMVWLAVVRALLWRHTGEDDVVIGTPVAGREHPDLASQIGFFVNMLPLRLPLRARDNGLTLLAAAREVTLGALAHQGYPYDRLVEDLALLRDMGRNPLFDVALSVTEWAAPATLPAGLTVQPFEFGARTSKFDLTFFLAEREDGSWDAAIEYSTDLFDADRIERLAGHLAQLAAGLGAQPAQPLAQLPMLTDAEREQVLVKWALAPSPYPRGESVTQLFARVARQYPDRSAALSRTGSFSYHELDSRSSGLADALAAHGAGPGTVVGILLPPSHWTPVAVLGVLKTGAAYLPLDPGHPIARTTAMLQDAGCTLVVGDAATLASAGPALSALAGFQVLELQAHSPKIAATGPGPAGPESPAYVIYTSGSTGRPKGTRVGHRAIARLVLGTNYIALGPHDRILQAGSLAFDASTFELFAALLTGGCVCFPAPREILEPSALRALLVDLQVTVMFCTTGLFNQLVDADPTLFTPLRCLLTGGERASAPHMRRLRAALPGLDLLHVYGPTENTTFSTWHRVGSDAGEEIPLGGPIANSSVYVLDRHGAALPVGVPGEICTGGDGLAMGYLGRPELSAERFVPHPFSPDERLYRTGDLGFWDRHGRLVFAGRIDEQVKVRGFRVEPGEVAQAMQSHPAVNEALVLARPTPAGTLELVGYFTATASVPASELRAHLADSLPEFMVPSRLMQLQAFPLNASLKIDRDALPDPVQPEVSASPLPARSEAERLLGELWQQLLGISPGLQDSFFALGGDSIRAIQLVSRLRQRGWALEVREVFEHPRLAPLALRLRLLQAQAQGQAAHRDAGRPAGPVPLSPVQHWFFDRHRGPLHHFNQSLLLQAAEMIDCTALMRAMAALQARHDALRLRFTQAGDAWQAEVAADVAPWVETRAWPHEDPAGQSQLLDALHGQFDLARGPLWRAVVLMGPDPSRQRLWLAAHHLVIDGVSWRVLLDDLDLAYRQARTGESVALGPPSASWRERVEQVQAFIPELAGSQEAMVWQALQARWTAGLASGAHGTWGETELVELQASASLTRELLGPVHRAYRTEVDDLLVAALGAALRSVWGPGPHAVTLEGHGREDLAQPLDLSRSVGWFTSVYPMLLENDGDDPREQLRAAKERRRAVPRRGMGFGLLVAAGVLDDRQASPALSFNYLGQFDDASEGLTFSLAPEASGRAIADTLNRVHDFDMTAAVSGGRLTLSVLCPKGQGGRGQALLEALLRALQALVAHALAAPSQCTPADFAECGLDLPTFDRLLERLAWAPEDLEALGRCTPMQQALLLHALMAPQDTAYRVQMRYGVDGPLEPTRFEAAWQQTCAAHPMLRSCLLHQGLAQPLRAVLARPRLAFDWQDLRALTPSSREARAQALADGALAEGFDFEQGPLLRWVVCRLEDSRWEVQWTYHHALIDGWSLSLVLGDFVRAYGGSPLSPRPDPAALIAWQLQQDVDASLGWWHQALAGYDEPVRLPARIASTGPQPREHVLHLPAPLSERLRVRAASAGSTPAALFHAAWALLLARLNACEDVVFGTVATGRPAQVPDSEHMVGPFIATVPLRIAVPPSATLVQVMVGARDAMLATAPHHHVATAELLAQSPLGAALFSHLVVVENYPDEIDPVASYAESALRITDLRAHDRTHHAFNLQIVPGREYLLRLQFDASRMHPGQAARLGRSLQRVLQAFADHPDTTCEAVDLLEPEDHAQWMTLGRGPVIAAQPDLLQRVARQAVDRPQALALCSDEGEMDFASLWSDVQRHAQALRVAGVGAGDRIAVQLPRRLAVPAVLLAIMSVGGVYVPIDPSYPPERIAYMLRDSQCRGRWDAHGLHLMAEVSPVPEGCRDLSRGAAYMIYTSGSTGEPKGVQVPHAALDSQLAWVIGEFGIGPGDRMLHKTPLSFDASVWELFAPLAAGATVVIAPEGVQADPQRLGECIARHRVTLLQLVPTQLAMLLAGGAFPRRHALRVLFLGGEALDGALLSALPQPLGFEVVNLYGPTEACINVSFARWDGSPRGAVPIGRPVANTLLCVLDPKGQPLPQGACGEICIAGEQLALGYWQRDDLSAQRFVHLPALGQRVYRTGDFGWWDEDGLLHYAGRRDGQIKLRGLRIECGEIESALRACEGVRDAVVVVVDDDLVAWVLAPTEADHPRSTSPRLPGHLQASLQDQLRSRLPRALVPSRWIACDAFPLAPSGKVDRRALQRRARAQAEQVPSDPAHPPEGLAGRLLAIWRSVLAAPALSVHDDFFAHGGHSLKALQLIARIERELGLRLPLAQLYGHPSVSLLAAHLEGAQAALPIRIPKAPVSADYPLSHAQQRLWLLHQLPGAAAAYNIPLAFQVSAGLLRADALERALAALLARHEVLRTAFVVVDGEPRQQVLAPLPVPVHEVDLRGRAQPQAAALELVEAQALEPFDLTRPPLLRASLARTDEDEGVLLLVLHHIVADGWSMRVLSHELSRLYRAAVGEPVRDLDSLPLQYKDYAAWQQSRPLEAEGQWWMQTLAGVPDGIDLGWDHPPTSQRAFRGSVVEVLLDSAVVRALRTQAGDRGTTLSSTVLALYLLTLYRLSGQSDLCVGMSMANRHPQELERLIGFFVNLLPVRVQIAQGMAFDALLESVAGAVNSALEHHDYPFDLLVQRLNPLRDATRQPLVNVVYAYQNFADVTLAEEAFAKADAGDRTNAGPRLEPLEFDYRTAKFDLTLFVTETPSGLRLQLEYDSELFVATTAKRHLDVLARFARMAAGVEGA